MGISLDRWNVGVYGEIKPGIYDLYASVQVSFL